MSEQPETARLKVFTSYAHEDEGFRRALEKQLALLKQQGQIEHWDDRHLMPGDNWNGEIEAKLNSADVIVLLVSTDFCVSKFVMEKEVKRARERHDAGEAVVVPIIVRAIDGWNKQPGLDMLQALPMKPGHNGEELVPIANWKRKDDAWENVAAGLGQTLRKIAGKYAAKRLPPPAALVAEAQSAEVPAAAEASAEGVKALAEWIAKPGVRAAVQKFRTDFSAASRQLALVADLKDLHDHLHTLRFQCHGFFLGESRRAEAAVKWESLEQPKTTLGQLLEQVQEIAGRPSLAGVDLAWVTRLESAHQELQEATESRRLPLLKTAVHRLGRLLAYTPLQIDILLRDSADALPLAQLEEALTQARQQLTGRDLASPHGQGIERGVASLARLHSGLAELTKEHTHWQELDAELRLIDYQIGTDTGELEFAWSGVKTRLLALCASSAEPWAALLQEEMGKLESGLASGVRAKVAETFHRIYSQAGMRFYDVDLKLKGLCGELRKIGAELDELLSANAHEPTPRSGPKS